MSFHSRLLAKTAKLPETDWFDIGELLAAIIHLLVLGEPLMQMLLARGGYSFLFLAGRRRLLLSAGNGYACAIPLSTVIILSKIE